jgi:hypothetical protein
MSSVHRNPRSPKGVCYCYYTLATAGASLGPLAGKIRHKPKLSVKVGKVPEVSADGYKVNPELFLKLK